MKTTSILTSNWRSFYHERFMALVFLLNLCVGLPFSAYLTFFLKPPNMPKRDKVSVMEQFRKIRPIGTIVFIAGVTSLLLAMQGGGGVTIYPWNDGRVISLFIVFGVTMPIFVWI